MPKTANNFSIPDNHSFGVKEYPSHDEVLNLMLNQIKPVDFESRAFPQLKELKQKVQKLNSKIYKSDGSFDETKEQDIQEWKRIQKEIDSLKVGKNHLLILSIEFINELAHANDWGLCINQGFIYLFNGAYWKSLEDPVFTKFLGEAAERLGVAKYTAKLYKFRDELLKQFQSDSYLPAPNPDNSKVVINLLNGTFEVTLTGTRLRNFERNDFITYQLPFVYDPNADAPIFNDYLTKVLPDVSRQQVISEFFGSVFIKNGTGIKLEKALLPYGAGANGKSVLFEIITALFGFENVSNFSLSNLTDSTGYYRAMIKDKILNYASEISNQLESAFFKQMTSGEPLPARLPYKNPITITQYAKLVFNVNKLPTEVEHSDAFFRRFLIIPFDVTIPEHEQDKELHKKIIEKELPGVFNWVLEGLNRLLKQRTFTYCEASELAVKQYKHESDSVAMFLEENNIVPSHENSIPLKEIYRQYRQYCKDSGCFSLGNINFGKRLERLGFVKVKGREGMLIYCGIQDESTGIIEEIKKLPF